MLVPIHCGVLDLANGEVRRSDGANVPLTGAERALLRYLADHTGRDVSRDELRASVLGQGDTSLSRAVDSMVTRLRRKLADGSGRRSLITIHGVGYRLVGPSPPERLDLGHVVVDLRTGRTEGRSARAILTSQQLSLLRALASCAGEPLSVDVLARRIGLPAHARAAVYNAVYRLRIAVEPDPTRPTSILTVRGRGFLLDVPAPAQAWASHTVQSVARHAVDVLGLGGSALYVRHGLKLVPSATYGRLCGARSAPSLCRLEAVADGAADRTEARVVTELARGRCQLAVPLVFSGYIVGALVCEARRASVFDDKASALASLADLASAAAAELGHPPIRAA
ncbi:MAG: winged helix-turn-helix domain-containing protein [Myxococcales bacterium]|nr:winged helix-turn-helix domain-containing protein [Myxococcales bacterium]